MNATAAGELLVALAVIITLARAFGALARRCGQPAVVGRSWSAWFSARPSSASGWLAGQQAVAHRLPFALFGVPYSARVSASGGDGHYTWSASGLPDGLSIAPDSGTISGTTDASGTFSVTIAVSDGESPPRRQSATLHLTIGPLPRDNSSSPQ
jgi:Putative Ig domain